MGPSHVAKSTKASFYMHVRGLPSIKVGFKGQRCIRGRQGFYSSGVEGFQIGDLVTKIGRVTGA